MAVVCPEPRLRPRLAWGASSQKRDFPLLNVGLGPKLLTPKAVDVPRLGKTPCRPVLLQGPTRTIIDLNRQPYVEANSLQT